MKFKEKLKIWKRYLSEAPENIEKYKEWKDTITKEENNYYSIYNNLNLQSNENKTIIWQNLKLSDSEELYFDWFSKNNKLMELVHPAVKYLQEDLQWGEYLTYDIAHLENEEDPSAVMPVYAAIFKFTPVPLIEEDFSYEEYIKKYKKIKWYRNLFYSSLLLILAAGMAITGYFIF